MNQLSDRLNSLSPSATLAMSQKSNELKAQGVDVINLSVGCLLYTSGDRTIASLVRGTENVSDASIRKLYGNESVSN